MARILDKVGIRIEGMVRMVIVGGGVMSLLGKNYVETSACMSGMATTLGLADGGHSEISTRQTLSVL